MGSSQGGCESQEARRGVLRRGAALEDPRALTIADPDAIDESRFICLGADPNGRILITVFAPRGRAMRIISTRKASRSERRPYENVR
jgi:uncharacterized protein